MNDLIVEQAAKVLGAATRRGWMNMRERSGLLSGGGRTLLGFAVDPIGVWRGSKIANLDTGDEAVLDASRR